MRDRLFALLLRLQLFGFRTLGRFALQPRSLWQRLRGTRVAARDVLASL